MKSTGALITLFALVLQDAAAKVAWAPASLTRVKPTMSAVPGATPPPVVINGQIVGGTKATAGQAPYQVNLIMDNVSICGGSLISKRWILTAAHCLQGRTRTVVRMGTLNWRLATEPNRVMMNSTTKIIHAQYNSTGRINNDVALLYLPADAPLNTYINTIALPKYSDATKTYAGFQSTICGWGLTTDGGQAVDELMCVTMPVINNTVCAQTYGTANIINSTICTSGANTKSTCRGDSGGPLTVVDGVRKQVGVVSFGLQSCQSGYPQAFARVTSFLTWINQNTGIPISA